MPGLPSYGRRGVLNTILGFLHPTIAAMVAFSGGGADWVDL